MTTLRDLVGARSVAVVGASTDPRRIGGRPVDFLVKSGFAGAIYPVNAKYAEVQGLRCYPQLSAIPGPVDAVIVSVPAREVPGVIEDCGKKGVKAAVVFSSGFSEVGSEGQALQAAITRVARETGVRVIGPNCQGFIAVHQGLNLSFSSAFADWGEPGGVGVVAQSGGVGGMLASLLRERRVGFSYWISSGNEADIDVPECIEFFADDPHTRIVGAYVENLRDGRRLLAAVARCRAAGKPVVILRAGRSAQAARAAASHTGAVAAENRVAAALLADGGVTEAHDVQELLDDLYVLGRTEPPAGNRIAILSNSGGLGVITSDTCAELGLELPELSPVVQDQLRAILPPFGAFGNPVDVTAQILADFTLLPRAFDVLMRAPEIDVVVVALGMVNRLYPVDSIVRELLRVRGETGKPVMVSWVAGAREGEEAIDAAGIPVFTDTTRCFKALAALVRSGRRPTASPPSGVSLPTGEAAELLRTAPSGTLDEHASKGLLRAFGVPTVPEQLVTTSEEAVRAASALGYPVVVKVCSAAIPHKSEHGLVKLGLSDPAAVRAACAELEATVRQRFPGQPVPGLLVQRMAARDGVELVLGARRDRVFGPVVMVGLGGVFIEYLNDVAFGLAPITREQGTRMLASLRGRPLLAGARGRPASDEGAIVDALVGLSSFAFAARDRVSEVDVNPLIALPRGAVAVDALVVLETASG